MNDRRHFLKVVGAAGLGCVAAACAEEGTGASEASGSIAAGNVKDLSVGDLRQVSGQPVAIGRDEGGVYAMSTICTHQQCDMTKDGSIASSGLKCDCHGSSFDRNGTPTGGPARGVLKHWKVDVANGAITVQAGTAVAADVRVAVT